ncbi:MAG: hypothetical protein HY066_09120 [Betaproteobacteria bacterium]|nr:hypothetical protein [Betaproteobacteria bacterium]
MKKIIVAIAGDPGGANALAPVLLRLRQMGIAQIQALAYREALPLWSKHGLVPESIDSEEGLRILEERLPGANLLLTATSVNGVDRERDAITTARRLGIPSLALLDFWSNYRLRFIDRDGKLNLPDRIAVMDILAADEMVAAGFPAERLEITGQPAFDGLAAQLAAFSPDRRVQLRRELGLADGDCLVLYVSQPLTALYGTPTQTRETIGFDEREVLALCVETLVQLATRLHRRVVMAIRRHPRESEVTPPSAQGKWFHAVIWNDVEKSEAVLSADLVLGMSSILLLEAVHLGQIVVSVQPGLKTPDTLPSNRDGSSIAVTEPASLEQALELAAFDDVWRRRHLLSLSAAELNPVAMGATEKVLKAAIHLLERTSYP